MEKAELTFGEKSVELPLIYTEGDLFNKIEFANQICAGAINQMHYLRYNSDSEECKALCSIAIRKLQTAHLSMIKALTWVD